jgi:molybdopterin-guanine dinucleotide biosynthesis protein A
MGHPSIPGDAAMTQMPAEGFVLAGGRSTRMGQDKALLLLGGRALLDLALEKLRALPLAAAPRVAASRPELASHGALIADLHPGCGPLSGIEAALAASSQRFNVFLPVDLPLLPSLFLLWMLERARITGALATIPCINGWPQPLCAVYQRELLGPMSAALTAGDHKVMPVIRAACHPGQSLDVFDVEGVASAQPDLFSFSPLPLYRWFHNCNTPEDMASIGNALVLTQ